jgi:hypothetical protein
VLPTLVFILWAYGMYALISTLAGRKGAKFRARGPGRRYGWLALAAGGLVGLGLTVVLAQSFNEKDHNLKLAGFLGTVWAEGWPDQVDRGVEYPPIKDTAAGEQPAYALLHPGTAPAELAQKKTLPKPRPIKKPKVRKPPVPQAKGAKPAVQVAKKDKGAAKGKPKTTTKKKKPAPPAPTAGKKSPETTG